MTDLVHKDNVASFKKQQKKKQEKQEVIVFAVQFIAIEDIF